MACQCVYAEAPYKRPRFRYAGRLPDQPDGQRKLHACWGSLRPYVTASIVVQAFVLFALVAGGAIALMLTVPASRISLITFWIGILDSVFHLEFRGESFYYPFGASGEESGRSSGEAAPLPLLFTIPFTALTAYIAIRFIRRFPRYAMEEEQAFRQGAEGWSLAGRIRSTAFFGTVHWNNYIYPIAAIIMIAFAGLWYLATYLRRLRGTGSPETAVYASAALHATYNVLVVVVIVPALIVPLWL